MAAGSRPKLVIVFHPHSISPLEIAESAHDVCDLLWVFDFGDPNLSPLLPLIRRLGPVIDTSGLRDEEIAESVAQYGPDGVMTFSELIPLAAAIAEKSNLRFHGLRTANLLANKYRQRLALAHAGVPGPEFWPVPADIDQSERAQLVRALSYPVVLKPQVGSGSQNTFRVGDSATLLGLLDLARSAGEDMLIEEELAEAHAREVQRFGEVLMVDSLVSDGRVTHYAVTGHFIPAEPFRGTGTFLPLGLGDVENRAVLEATEAALTALGVNTGLTNTDLILTPDGPRVLEVNGRIGGQVPALITLAGGAPLLPQVMRFSVRESDGDILPSPSNPVAFCAMYQAPMQAERLLELNGLDQVAEIPGISQIIPDCQVGDALDWRRGTVSRLFMVYGVADDHDHLYHLYKQIQQSILARYEMVER